MDFTYQALRAHVDERLLFKRRYGYYSLYASFVILGNLLALYLLSVDTNLYEVILSALFFAFMTVQGGMLGHDLSHKQVFESDAKNRFFGMLAWGLLAGLSESKWFQKHNDHHKHVNQIGKDPDIEFPFVFSDKQYEMQSKFVKRWLLPYQHVLFFLALPFIYFGTVFHGLLHVFAHISRRTSVELALICLHFFAIGYVAFVYLTLGHAIVFFALYLLTVGLYMSLVFAPNHKGEEVHATDEKLQWIDQITSTRNVRPSWFIFHMFGGLNFQIEHHLFTTMPRPNYWKAHPIVKEFCREHQVPFYETTWFGSLQEIYVSLKQQASR